MHEFIGTAKSCWTFFFFFFLFFRENSHWGTFMSFWAWQAGSRVQTKALGHMGLEFGLSGW